MGFFLQDAESSWSNTKKVVWTIIVIIVQILITASAVRLPVKIIFGLLAFGMLMLGLFVGGVFN